MRLILGPPPNDTEFLSEQQGWKKCRELPPWSLVIVGTILGIPLAWVIAKAWFISVPGMTLTVSFNFSDPSLMKRLITAISPLAISVAFTVGLLMIHELIHALAMPGMGLTSQTVIGFWPRKILPYAAHLGSMPNYRYILTGFAPFAVISLFPLVIALAGVSASKVFVVASIVNALCSGGDAVAFIGLAIQVPWRATIRNKGWDTWFI